MNKGWLWFLGGALLVFIVGIALRFFGFGGVFNYRMFPHMGSWGILPFGWMMLWVGLIPLLVVVLLVVGIVVLIRSSSSSTSKTVKEIPDNTPKTCPSCNRTVQKEWKHCPYCGADLES